MIRRLLDTLVLFVRSLLSPPPVRLAIVRRYQDANGNYVGELYIDKTVRRKHDTIIGYTMIGVSLDSVPLDAGYVDCPSGPLPIADYGWKLDTAHDFLTPMPPMTIRVGALDPKDNDEVRRMVAKLPRRNMRLTVQNRFMMDLRPAGPLAFNLMNKTPQQIFDEFDKPC